LKIEELTKPQGTWCRHCKPGKGCLIYGSRPAECRNFYCGYLTNAALGEEWKPSTCKIVLVVELDGNRIAAHADPHRPNAWRQAPYHSTLREMARLAAPLRGQVVAYVGRNAHMIFPDRDVDLGIVGDDELIITGERRTPSGVRLEAYKMHKDDPRAQSLAPQQWASETLKESTT
jgi:hypothetical protein